MNSQADLAMILPGQDNAQNWWRCISLLLMHNSIGHLLNNIMVQLTMGLTLECVNGPHRISLLFLVGGLMGVLCETLLGEC